MKKQAKFFCENCGEEVKQNARFCNKCGRFFSAVRCPACGKIGSSHAFTNGCPACGYADKQNKKTNLSNSLEKQSLKKNHFYLKNPKLNVNSKNKKNKSYNSSSSLPLWIYFFTLSLLILMIVLLMRCSL